MMAYLPDWEFTKSVLILMAAALGYVLLQALAMACAIVIRLFLIVLKVCFYALVASMVVLILIVLGALANSLLWGITLPIRPWHAPFTWRRWRQRLRDLDPVKVIFDIAMDAKPSIPSPMAGHDYHENGMILDNDEWEIPLPPKRRKPKQRNKVPALPRPRKQAA